RPDPQDPATHLSGVRRPLSKRVRRPRTVLLAALGAGRLSPMRVLVIGSGGREHALCRALATDPAVTGLHVAPGDPGLAAHAARPEVASAAPAAIGALVRRLAPGLVVIGQETPLVAGVADVLAAAGIACFGPVRDAAMIEGSKSFAKDVMAAAGIPTAAAVT